MIKEGERVSTVDGFRCIAILAVMSYHYLYRFSPPLSEKNYYPYQYEQSIFQYGFFGVQLFFIISGFVISQTLQKTSTLKAFAVKRLIRLWPAMILCSTITFFVVMLMDQRQQFPFFHSRTVLDFLPSWTFIPPILWNAILNREGIAYVDGVYWSLFAEIVFYIFGGIIFFLKPRAFLQNWLGATLFVNSIRLVTSPKNHFLFPDNINSVFSIIYNVYLELHFSYWVYFSLGVFFYHLYSKNIRHRSAIVMMAMLVGLEVYFIGDNTLRILLLAVIVLFLILVYRESWLSFLRLKGVVWIGLVSYPLYLLHENIGIILINRIGEITNRIGAAYLPFIIAIVMLVVSSLIFKFYERPITSYLKSKIFKIHKY
jgi:peptidoglycan/LPS O-acetylase OafA/YrhL